MAVQTGRDSWPAITRAVKASSGRIVAAIGYVGSDAHYLLPLGTNDVLLCDASEVTVRSGATNPYGLKPFLRAGVRVFSAEGLHAKVVVLPRRAFVGSMNASRHSAHDLIEASIETINSNEVQSLRTFVLDQCLRQLDVEDVDQLIKHVPKRRPKRPIDRQVAEVPKRLDRVVVIGYELGGWTKSTQKAHDESRRGAQGVGRRLGRGVRTQPIEVTPWVFDRVKEGDWVIQQSESTVHSPGIVIEKVAHRAGRLIWMARPEMNYDDIALEQAVGVIPVVNQASFLTGSKATLATDLFR